ncbi:MAG: VWA domain-containing protein, partial [Nitrospiria bacterium]
DFHFLRPDWLWLLPVLGLLLWGYARRKAVSRSWQAVCDPELLPHLLIDRAKERRARDATCILAFAGLLALMALAGPAWEQLEQPVFREQSAWVVVLDLSRSMDAADLKPSRLARARHKLIDILKKRREGQTALIVYAAEPFVVSPLTQDAETIISQVSALRTELIPKQGSRPDLALEKAEALLKQAGVPRGKILLITDGIENTPQTALETVVARLTRQGYRLSVLGVGTAEGAPISLPRGGFLKNRGGEIVIAKLDNLSLRMLALQGEGRYQVMTVDDADITALLSEIAPKILENQGEETGLKADIWREEGPWLLLPLLFLSALAFRRGVLAVFLLTALFFPRTADAFEWDALWTRPDQRAATLFSAGDEEKAAGLFENPEWKAAAHYRAGQYEESVRALEGLDTPDALYNKGNALAKLGRVPEAMQAYDEALKIDPEHADARHNLDLLEQQQEKQENPNQNKPEEGESGENEEGEPSDEPGENPENTPDQTGDQNPSDDQQPSPGNEGEEKDGPPPQSAENEDDSEKEGQREEAKSQDQETPGDDNQQTARAEKDEDMDMPDEARLANEQWLRRIPDDPGGLLRRKFLYQSRLRQAEPGEENAW